MILAVTALPRGLLQVHWAAMRVVTDGRRLFSTQVLLGVLLLSSTWVGAQHWGIFLQDGGKMRRIAPSRTKQAMRAGSCPIY